MTDAAARSWTLPLPYEKLPLSLNDRKHHMVIWRTRHNLRNQVRTLARHHRIPRLERIHVELHYRPATVNTRDEDNAVATLKPAIDGLRDYPAKYTIRNGIRVLTEAAWVGIVPDDTRDHVTWEPPTIHNPEPIVRGDHAPRVWLVITDTTETTQ